MKWWRFVVASEIRKILAFRTDFWVTFLGQTLIQIFIARSLWQAIFDASGKTVMEGYTIQTMTLYYLIVPIGSKMLTGENMGFLSREIYEGTFNRYLLYPISFFNYKTLTYLTYSAFYGIQLSLAFIGYHLVFDQFDLNQVIQLSYGLFFFMLASYAYCNMALFIELISIWADNIWSLMVMARFLCFFFGGAYIPLTFFPEILQTIITFTPFPYLVSLPINAMMGRLSLQEMIYGVIVLLVWSLIFNWLAKRLWGKGQYHYSGVGI
jgi:ABC-2 type transport system permease protein